MIVYPPPLLPPCCCNCCDGCCCMEDDDFFFFRTFVSTTSHPIVLGLIGRRMSHLFRQRNNLLRWHLHKGGERGGGGGCRANGRVGVMAAYDDGGDKPFTGVFASKISVWKKFLGPKSVTTLLQWIILKILCFFQRWFDSFLSLPAYRISRGKKFANQT